MTIFKKNKTATTRPAENDRHVVQTIGDKTATTRLANNEAHEDLVVWTRLQIQRHLQGVIARHRRRREDITSGA